MDTQHGSKDSDEGKSRIIATGHTNVNVTDKPFVLLKAKSSNPMIPDYYKWEWAVVTGDPTDKHSYREHDVVSGDTVEKIIKKFKLAMVLRNEFGEVWEEPGQPYLTTHSGAFADYEDSERRKKDDKRIRRALARQRNREAAKFRYLLWKKFNKE